MLAYDRMGYIYVITNVLNGKQYVGQTRRKDVYKRWKEHKRDGAKGGGGCRAIVNAIHKYGIQNFTFKIVCVCFDDDLNDLEPFYVQKYGTLVPNGYNLTKGGEGGAKSAETRQRMSEAAKNRSEEYRRKLSEANKGKIFSDEHRQKMSEAQTARRAREKALQSAPQLLQ